MDLGAFRDDAHLAAWRPLGVSGSAWELLTLLWRDGDATPEALHHKLLHRGITRAAHAESFSELLAHGWVTRHGDQYRLSGSGRAAREQAEALTDRLFYGPWSSLSEVEQDELRQLLISCRQGLDRLRGVTA